MSNPPAKLLGNLGTGLEVLHETTALVVQAVPLDFAAGSAVEDQADGATSLPDLARDVVTVTELIAEALAAVVDEDTTDTTESLGSQELDLGVGLLGVDETSRVHLDLLHVNGVGAKGEGHLDTVTSRVVTVGGGKVVDVRAVLLEERVRGEVGSVTASGEDDRAVFLVGLAAHLELATNDLLAVGGGEKTGDAGLLEDAHVGGLALGEVLEHLHQSVGDGHARELLSTTVGTGLGVATETRDEREVDAELLHDPLDGRGRVVGKDLGQGGDDEVTSRAGRVLVEDVDRVLKIGASECDLAGVPDA